MKQFLLISILSLSISFQGVSQQTEIQKSIREMLELTGSGKLGVQVANQLIDNFSQAYPDVSQEFWQKFKKEINPDELIDLIIPIYEKHFSLEEIKQLIAFYKTPLGKKTTSTLPQISAESMKAGQNWGREIAQKVIKQLEENK